ncbi:MAG: protein-glutamate O-methyltransferase CheR, partial [Terriglobales bacterium]
LVQKAIPEILERNKTGRQLLVWSAGCSTGEEPYTLAMVLNEWRQTRPGFQFNILATDMSTIVLNKAHRGVFHTDTLNSVPAGLQRKYFMRSRDRDSKFVRVVPEVRRQVEFRRLNFMEDDFGLSEFADVIFCRNVMIYFDRPTQERIVQKLARNLSPGGYAFVGHSESLHGMDIPLVPVAPALYRKQYRS